MTTKQIPLWHEIEVPFSLACMDCDDGQHIGSEKDAIKAGWSDISFEPDGMWWSHVGLCPTCKKEWQ